VVAIARHRPLRLTLLRQQVHKLLGKGSYGKVYKVQRGTDGQFYALKETELGGMSQLERADAVNEVRLLVSINHPSVVSGSAMRASSACMHAQRLRRGRGACLARLPEAGAHTHGSSGCCARVRGAQQQLVQQGRSLHARPPFLSLPRRKQIRYHEAFLNGNKLCVVMEYAPFGDLKYYVSKGLRLNAPFPEEAIWRIFLQLCQ
jgi:serine/threonine protein kinase